MDVPLPALIHLQSFDTRIAALEAEVARLPRELAAIQAAVAAVRREVDGFRARLEQAKKDIRAKERDLDDIGVKRSRAEARLYEVKNNTEYSAVLTEIETIKRDKAQREEEILALMELGERLALDVREAEGRLRAREAEAAREEAAVRDKLAGVERELELVRAERAGVARELPAGLLADYERVLRARANLAVTPVAAGFCGGCRVTIRPQAILMIRAAAELIRCESCGRYLYWPDQA